MAGNKRLRVEAARSKGVYRRKGVTRRKPTCWVVFMRLLKPFSDLRMHFGTYKTELDANIARNYAASVRISVGEDHATASGFDLDNHPSEFEFEDCREVFERSELSEALKLRCDEYRTILDLYTQQPPENRSGNTKCELKKFCEKARKDIAVAIEAFRRSYPQKDLHCQPTETPSDFPRVESVEGEVHSTPSPSNPKVRVTPKPTTGDGGTPSSNFTDVTVAMTWNGSVRTLLAEKLPASDAEQLFEFAKPRCEKLYQEFFFSTDDFWEGLGECPLDPLDIPEVLE